MKSHLSWVVAVLFCAGGLLAAPGWLWDAGLTSAVLAADDDEQDQPSFEELNKRIEIALDGRKFDEALDLADKALKLKPEDATTLRMATRLAQSLAMQRSRTDRPAANKLFLRSAGYLRRLSKAHDLNAQDQRFAATVLYNEACAHATSDQKKEALASLKEALEAGFNNFDVLQNDQDLNGLREDPEFIKLVDVVLEAQKKQQLQEIQKQLAENEPFKFDFSLESIDGKKVQLADFKGKVLIVDFWGTWCPPCRKEIPHFVELRDKYQKAGLEIVGINYEGGDPAEAVEKIKKFNSSNGVKYQCLLGDTATRDQVPNFRGYPTTLFLDGSGVVRLKVVGYHSYGHLETIVKLLLDKEKQEAGG